MLNLSCNSLFILAVYLLCAGTALSDAPLYVAVDCSKAPECEAFAARSKTLVEEWYPKINGILFGKDHPLRIVNLVLLFEPMHGVAHTSNDRVHISAEWVSKKAPGDYGMVIHELTHVVQDYKGKGEGWITEGIADYLRDRYYEPGIRKQQINPQTSSYKQGYGVAAAFLIWLEDNKNKEIVFRLNAASHDGTYRRELFQDLCGADLDALWKEFVGAQEK